MGKVCNLDMSSSRLNSDDVCTSGAQRRASANGRKREMVALHGRSLTCRCSKAKRSSTHEESVTRTSGRSIFERRERDLAKQQLERKIRTIVRGDGSRSGQLHLKKKLWYASARGNGGVEHFHDIDPYSIKMRVEG